MEKRSSLLPTLAATACLCLHLSGGGLLNAYSAPVESSAKPMLGFSAASSEHQRALESKLDARVNKENLRNWMQRLTARPHHLGSPFGKEVADFIANQFRSWGYETEIEQFDVLFPTPKERSLEMIAPERFTASLVEPGLAADSTSNLKDEQLPSYNAYSIDGDVTGELVYVNFGVPKDYEILEERGISVRGRIVLARYGGSWRGIKAKVAAEHGALGCIIYSDPHEEGYFEGETYPKGAWRNETGVERGSVADMPVYPGDPLTPGVGATKEAKRLAQKDASTLTKIPVLPISYSDALPLLRALQGPVAPEPWRGALPVTYRLGPGPAQVHLRLQFEWRSVPAYDVIARLKGTDRPDQWVIRGNHHDAWVCGAEDPISGTVAMMEEARVLAELVKDGWKPKRSILFCAWDGEEPGLLGSTEWVETHAAELKQHAVAYVNSDNNARGYLRAGGSHALERLVSEVAEEVADPETNVSVAERLRARALVLGSGDERRQIREHPGLRIRALGSGSDYTPFLQHLGVASLDLRFGGEGEGGSYHSIYDSFDHYTRFIDPAFEYGAALARTAGRVVLRLANADLLPFHFTSLGDTLARYQNEVLKLADDMREDTKETNRLIRDRVFELASDPALKLKPPVAKSDVPYFNFSPLQNSVARVQEHARLLRDELSKLDFKTRTLAEARQIEYDALVMRMEQLLTREEGLPRRPWYKHMVYAPGFYTGYGVKTLPGIREAIEERQWDDVNAQIENTAMVLNRFADELAQLVSKVSADTSASKP